MKLRNRLWLLACLAALGILVFAACGGDAPERAAPSPDPSAPSPVDFTAADFSDPDTCQMCHAEIYEQWKGGLHHLAWENSLFQELYLMASAETDGLTDEYCAACHTPIGVLSGEVPPADGSNLSEIGTKGISCDFCHTVTDMAHIGNSGYIVTPGDTKYGPRDDAVSPTHGCEYSEFHTRSEFCGTCHDVSHPVNEIPLERTYTEWKEGPYNTGDPETSTHCQDCHMTPGVGYNQNPGRAATGGPERDHVFTHDIVGGSSGFFDQHGSPDKARKAEERLQGAASLEIIGDGQARAQDIYRFKVQVNNDGAGHKLPTGLTEVRQMWLEVVVRDQQGNTIYDSGLLDPDGDVDKDAVMYNMGVADADGNYTVKVWLAERVLYDYRIPPKGYALEDYSFLVPEGYQGDLEISVRLLYRSAPQYLLDMVFGKGVVTMPVVEMTTSTSRVRVSP